jgi:ribonuclease HI
MKNMKKVDIYTDGACSGNPGPGGFGAVLLFGGHRKEISGAYRLTTNNRMELLAAIVGLEALNQACEVRLFSDSRYLVDSISKGWVSRWKANNWKRNKSDTAVNVDLWERLLPLLNLHKVEFLWVRGHSDNVENNRCDALARGAIEAASASVSGESGEVGFLEDSGYVPIRED